MSFDAVSIRPDFPALGERIAGREVVYLDNACMTLKPRAVIDAIVGYYTRASGCHGRSDHAFGRRATELVDGARAEVRRFIGAKHDREVIFTRNTTEAINLVARGIGLAPKDAVVCSDIEHNSNLVPWQVLKEDVGIRHLVVPTRPDTTFDLDALSRTLAGGGVRLVSMLHTSNLTGVTFPVAQIVEIAHKHGARVLVDAAQSMLTHPLDVRRLGADFVAFSVHKMLGPTGVGVLYVRDDLLETLKPLVTGGETVLDTTYAGREIAGAPDRFEAGLQDYAGIAGAGAAVKYVAHLSQDRIREHVTALNAAATEGLMALPGVRVLGPADPAARGAILNFIVERMQAADLSRILSEASGIMVRAGRHCVHSWYNATLAADSVRVSFGPYNTRDEVEYLVRTAGDVLRHFR